jgi:hypothetical protein
MDGARVAQARGQQNRKGKLKPPIRPGSRASGGTSIWSHNHYLLGMNEIQVFSLLLCL